MRRPLVLALAVLALALAASPAAAAAAPPVSPPGLTIGIADNKPDMFGDLRFAFLGVRHVRLDVPWDALGDPVARARLDRWMAGARLLRVQPLLTFDRSPRRKSYNPTPAQMASALRGLRARYPGQVREIATWNEANLGKRPELVAAWWKALRGACLSCTVLAVELVDDPGAVDWARRFVKAAGREPAVWGLHNYADVNRFSTKGTRAFLAAVKGDVWLTETGGVQSRQNTTRVRFAGKGPTHAAKAMTFLFSSVAGLSPRIKRVYVYHWNAPAGPLTWDSALVGPTGDRPALTVLRKVLAGRLTIRRPRKPVLFVPPVLGGKPGKGVKPAQGGRPGRSDKGDAPGGDDPRPPKG